MLALHPAMRPPPNILMGMTLGHRNGPNRPMTAAETEVHPRLVHVRLFVQPKACGPKWWYLAAGTDMFLTPVPQPRCKRKEAGVICLLYTLKIGR